MVSNELYTSYWPDRIMTQLKTVGEIKCFHVLLRKVKYARHTEEIPFSQKDVPGLGRTAFYRALKALESNSFIYVDKSNCHEFKITLKENYYTTYELNKLKGKE